MLRKITIHIQFLCKGGISFFGRLSHLFQISLFHKICPHFGCISLCTGYIILCSQIEISPRSSVFFLIYPQFLILLSCLHKRQSILFIHLGRLSGTKCLMWIYLKIDSNIMLLTIQRLSLIRDIIDGTGKRLQIIQQVRSSKAKFQFHIPTFKRIMCLGCLHINRRLFSFFQFCI